MNVSRTLLLYRLLIAAFILTTASLQGQGFIKTYPPAGSGARDVVQANDGGYFMVGEIPSTGQMFLQKTGPTGTVVWTNHLDLDGARAIAACKAPDGDLVVLAENFADAAGLHNLVMKVTPAGAVVWQTLVPNTFLPNGLRDIIVTSDGNLLAAGDTRDAQLQQNVWLVKLDAGGNILWTKSWGDPGFNEQVSRLVEMPGGYITVSGAAMHGADRDLFLAQANPTGDLVWQKWYAKPGTQIAYDLIRMSDGGLTVLADTYGTNPTRITLLKTDADGAEDFYQQIFPWQIDVNNAVYSISSFVRDDADNVYIVGSGGNIDITNLTIFLIKMDYTGQFVWKTDLGLADIPWQIINTADNKFAICGGQVSAGAFLVKSTQAGEIYTNKIAGNVYHDANDNCEEDTGETALRDFIVRAENQAGEVFFHNTAPDGSYLIAVSEGDFTLSVIPVYGSQNFWAACNTQTVSVAGVYQTVQAGPLGLRSTVDCPLMYVEIGASLVRRCFSNRYDLVYCNNGNMTATDAYVELTLSDPVLEYDTSSIPLASQNGNVLRFDLPDVEPGTCGNFSVNLIVNCEAELGDEVCVEAHIFPDSICTPGQGWDGSQVEVTGHCDGKVNFTIRNTGWGNMAGTVDYVIVEDQIMYMQGNFQLKAGEDTVITVDNPGGGPYFLQTAQRPGYPGLSAPSAIVSPCGGPANSSVLQFPNDEAETYIAVFCDQVIGSFDPNDKRGFPLGWKDAHYIERNQDIEYMIRFQNTGTDTAFTVEVRDTISALLDITTVRPGVSSHPFTFELTGAGVLVFRFPDINLVDSFKNEPASHGYVTFSVAQQPDLPLGTVIENNAAIYFDFNTPVITNTYSHTVGKPFTTFVKDPGSANLQLFPNPFTEQTLFRLNGLTSGAPIQLTLYDTQGNTVRQDNFTGTEYLFRNNGLLPGLYFYRLEQQGQVLASGKVVKH